jgi:hypothetical protein
MDRHPTHGARRSVGGRGKDESETMIAISTVRIAAAVITLVVAISSLIVRAGRTIILRVRRESDGQQAESEQRENTAEGTGGFHNIYC